jgi:gamma-glutamyltranspeptidase/glutathione hydrolase
MVACSQRLATAAGVQVLREGGNAADASITVAAVLSVTEPCSTGLGGDMFAMFYEAASRTITALNGSGRSPQALSLELLKQQGLDALPLYHPYTITVPGACAGWCDLLERHGTMELGVLLEPAIRLAQDGFPVAPITSHFWKVGVEKQLRSALNGEDLTIGGRGPEPGELFRNPGLARTLEAIAAGGKKAFYQGEIASAITATLREAGGCLDETDLAAHLSTWQEPISGDHGEYRLWECPPNGQGLAALLAVNILAGMDLPPDPLSPDRLHLEIEAMRLAFADARWFVADPSFSPIPIQELLSPEYAARRRALIDPGRANPGSQHGMPAAGSDTVYFCVVDKWGNACSFINSNFMGFGTGIVPRGCGFSLQNRGMGFSLQPGHLNVLEPGKRPYHTIIPGMITRRVDGSLVGPVGVMGGFMQPQGHLQVLLALAQDLDPQAALELPRFCILGGTPGGVVALEPGIPWQAVAELEHRGHTVKIIEGWERAVFGRGQVILQDGKTGTLTGGSDPRADGCAQAVL